jgi:hypothetical protein
MVEVADLRLDSRNPRLAGRNGSKTQPDLLVELYRRYDLDQLLTSLAENGYFSEEPLIVIPEEGHSVEQPPYIVVEGNRRLGALKILLFKEDREAVRVRRLPAIAGHAKPLLNPVPVKVYATRAEVLPYLGVRHIAGVKPWEALAKAKYVRSAIEGGLSLGEVARRIGSGRRTDVVRRWLLTLYALEQANREADEPWSEVVEEGFDFSWLYTSLGYRSVREYLDIAPKVFSDPSESPVPKKSVHNLLNHMKDLYGPPGRSREAAVRESREISTLASVYASKDALDVFRAGAPLAVAYRKTVGEETQLVDLLRDANYRLTEANGIAPHHKGQREAITYARRCVEASQALVSTLEE